MILVITQYSSMMSVRNFVSATTEAEGWDPSESEDDEIILSRSSKMTTEGAWSNASDIMLESAWRIVKAFSNASPEQETNILQIKENQTITFHSHKLLLVKVYVTSRGAMSYNKVLISKQIAGHGLFVWLLHPLSDGYWSTHML